MWDEIKENYMKKFKDFSIVITPPCMSVNRESEYVYLAMSCAIGEKSSPFVTIDYEKKKVIVKR